MYNKNCIEDCRLKLKENQKIGLIPTRFTKICHRLLLEIFIDFPFFYILSFKKTERVN